jgi:hypothetical protein
VSLGRLLIVSYNASHSNFRIRFITTVGSLKITALFSLAARRPYLYLFQKLKLSLCLVNSYYHDEVWGSGDIASHVIRNKNSYKVLKRW